VIIRTRYNGPQFWDGGKSLDLYFARDKSLDPRITFTRASSGTYFDASGVLQTATTDEPRFDHNPVTGESLGLLVEGAATNLLTYSEDFSNAAWVTAGQGVSVSANQVAAPDGALTADKLVEDTSTGVHRTYQGAVFTSGVSYTYSAYVKDAGRTILSINNSSLSGQTFFNLSTGVASTAFGTIEDVGNGWYRIAYTGTSSSTGVLNVEVRLVQSGTTTSYTGDGTSGIYIWGAQLETGSRASSYIKTEASTVTRAADSSSMTGTNFSSWFNAAEGTFVVDMSVNSAAGTAFLFVAGNAAADNALYMTRAPGNEIIQGESFITPTNVSLPTISVSSGEFFKTAYAYKANDYAVSTDASALATNTSLLVPAGIDRLGIGYLYEGASGHINGTIKRLTYYPRRLTNGNLQELTS